MTTRLEGSINSIVYKNESGWSIISFDTQNENITLSIVQNGLNEGDFIEVFGDFVDHPKFGRQFKVKEFFYKKPKTKEAIYNYLKGLKISGLGEKTILKIIDENDNILDQLDENVDLIKQYKNVDYDDFLKKWTENKKERSVILFLEELGISFSQSQKLYLEYGDKVLTNIKENPYSLMELKNIGFKFCDNIALKLNYDKKSYERICAGINYVLSQEVSNGSACVEESYLISELLDLLSLDDIDDFAEILIAMEELKLAKRVIINNISYIYKYNYYKYEYFSALKISDLLKESVTQETTLDSKIEAESLVRNISLSDEQKESIKEIINNKISILTGSAGSGKTTTIKVLINVLTSLNKTIALCAPTGRASQRMKEITGIDATTIHRLLQWSPEESRFQIDSSNQLKQDFIIIDETSMTDLRILYYLLKGINPSTSQVLFVGDVKQLESVDVGRVLYSLINSKKIKTLNLTKVFRQDESSKIIKYANEIIKEIIPQIENPLVKIDLFKNQTDCLFIDSDQLDQDEMNKILNNKSKYSTTYHKNSSVWIKKTCLDIVEVLATSLVKKYYNIDDVQILSPMKKGSLGVLNLNHTIQKKINPSSVEKNELKFGDRIFREGDKIIQLKNNYKLNIFNGDIGLIEKINVEERKITAQFNEKKLTIEKDDFDNIDLAYAITIHKSQGSEFDAVIIPILKSHYHMLTNNLIYTAMTRGKKLVVFVGSRKALSIGIKTKNINDRISHLDYFINLNMENHTN